MTTRFERAEVYEGVQWGVETTPGTVVPADKILYGLTFEFDHMTDIKPYRPAGRKFNTASQRGKEMTSGRIEGIQCYNDMIYLGNSWMNKTAPNVPVNNSTWNVTGATGTFGFTYKGQVLAPAAWANAAALQAAIGALTSVGAGNVEVTAGGSGVYTIQFIGALSTDTSAIGTVTGTPLATVTLNTAGTLTNRWKFLMAPAGPDDVQTFTLEKGASGVSNMGQRAAFGFIGGLQFKHTKSEASFTGDLMARTTTDSVTMTSSPTVVPCVPIDPRDTSVYMGTSLTNMLLMDRLLEMDFGVQQRANGLITVNKKDPSFSNRIETAPQLTSRFFIEHDSAGQTMLANLRAGTGLYTVVETVGPQIEPGFNYRLRWTLYQELLKPDPSSIDGVFGMNYQSELKESPVFGSAIMLEIDTPLSAL